MLKNKIFLIKRILRIKLFLSGTLLESLWYHFGTRFSASTIGYEAIHEIAAILPLLRAILM